ncbi:phage DNA packaging protein J [Roseovarius sp. 217]
MSSTGSGARPPQPLNTTMDRRAGANNWFI